MRRHCGTKRSSILKGSYYNAKQSIKLVIYTQMTLNAILASFKFEMALQKDKSQHITQKTSYKHIRAKTNSPSLRGLELVSEWKRYILGISLAFFLHLPYMTTF